MPKKNFRTPLKKRVRAQSESVFPVILAKGRNEEKGVADGKVLARGVFPHPMDVSGAGTVRKKVRI